jgi:hypothetical protein
VNVSDLAIVAALVFAWGRCRPGLERFDITAPIIFVAGGQRPPGPEDRAQFGLR